MKIKFIFLALIFPMIISAQKEETPLLDPKPDPIENISDQDNPSRDQTIADDLIVQGSECAGLDCITNEVFGSDIQRYKENILRIHFDDTSDPAGFPANDWRILINDSSVGGENYFSVEDVTGTRRPFTIKAGAVENALYIDDFSQPRIGIGTNTPATTIHMADGNSPTLRLEQNASGGFSTQTWDIVGNEANFFIRDVTNGSSLPFRIEPGAPSSSIYIDTDGNIGLGTSTPAHTLHVVGDIAKTGSMVGVSDKRVKTNINTVTGALAIINALDGKSYDFKTKEFSSLELPEGMQYGLIAQEVEEVLETIVSKNFMHTKDQDGNSIDLKGVNYEQLIPILINAIKEQNKTIVKLSSESKSTQARLAALEAKLIE